MNEKYCQIVLIGHRPEKLQYSIDKEIFHKLIFITEKERLSGTDQALKTIKDLIRDYQSREVEVEHVQFSFHVQTKPIAELTHLIYQQKLQGLSQISVNASGGLRYMCIWFYIACSITNTRIIHADYIYKGSEEVGINSNFDLVVIPSYGITDKQFEFLKLFFQNFNTYEEFFDVDLKFAENPLLINMIRYNSLEDIRKTLQRKRNEKLSRGSIDGLIQKLNKVSALSIYSNPNDKKQKSISISYLGIAYFLDKLFKDHFQ